MRMMNAAGKDHRPATDETKMSILIVDQRWRRLRRWMRTFQGKRVILARLIFLALDWRVILHDDRLMSSDDWFLRNPRGGENGHRRRNQRA